MQACVGIKTWAQCSADVACVPKLRVLWAWVLYWSITGCCEKFINFGRDNLWTLPMKVFLHCNFQGRVWVVLFLNKSLVLELHRCIPDRGGCVPILCFILFSTYWTMLRSINNDNNNRDLDQFSSAVCQFFWTPLEYVLWMGRSTTKAQGVYSVADDFSTMCFTEMQMIADLK